MKKTTTIVAMLALCLQSADATAQSSSVPVKTTCMSDKVPAEVANVGDPSERCLSCHDGSLAGNRRGGLNGDRSSEHPVQISYVRAFYKKPGKFRHPSTLDPRIKLHKGQLQCKTCHNMKSSETKARLVMSNYRSRLCLSCHIK